VAIYLSISLAIYLSISLAISVRICAIAGLVCAIRG